MRFPISILICLMLIGCSDSDESNPKIKEPIKLTNTKPATHADLQAIIDRDGAITFLSFNGEWIGSDIDSSYTFFDGGEFHLTRYGIAIFHHDGRYSFDGNNVQFVVQTGTPDQPTWESHFKLARDGIDLVLIPEDQMARGSFRQVDTEKNQSTVNAINEWKKQISTQPQAVE